MRLDSDVTTVHVNGEHVADVHRNYQGLLDKIVFQARANERKKLVLLQGTLTYAQQYVQKLSQEEVEKLSRIELEKSVRELGIEITEVWYATAKEAIKAAIELVGYSYLHAQFGMKGGALDEWAVVKFQTKAPYSFMFWKSETRPDREYEGLHLVPSYHPVMRGWHDVGLVNGDTDAFIRGSAVRSIHCPRTARTNTGRVGMGSWSQVNHPYRVSGKWLTLTLDTINLCSKEGVEELARVLRASLMLERTYIAISGGFRAPLQSPHNRLVSTKRRSPWPQAGQRGEGGHLARGSEDHCVWAYRTLRREGVLKGSYVPEWFTQEGWLGIYDGAEVRPGLY